MAWTDQCKFEAVRQIDHHIEKGKPVREALDAVSRESDIPPGTLKRWKYPSASVPKNGNKRIDFEGKLKRAIRFYGLAGIHPAANLVRYMTAQEYDGLVESVEAIGFIQPISVTTDGLVVDGRMRLCASLDAARPLPIERIDPSDPIAFNMSKNLYRVHLTTDQRAAIVAACQCHEVAN